jgi:hypothetical protein
MEQKLKANAGSAVPTTLSMRKDALSAKIADHQSAAEQHWFFS